MRFSYSFLVVAATILSSAVSVAAQIPAIEIRPADVVQELEQVTDTEDSDAGEDATETLPSQIENPTHRQSQIFYPEKDGKKLKLHSFCVSPNGMVLAVCGLPINSSGQQDGETAGYIVAFQADGTQSVLTPLSFPATAISCAPDASIYIAGDGQVAHLDTKGETLQLSDAPNMGNKEEMLALAKKTAEARTKQYTEVYQNQMEMIQERVDDLEAKDEEELTRADKSRLSAYQRQLESMKSLVEQRTFTAENVLATGRRITAISTNGKDVYVSCGSISGAGYSIWRTDSDLGNPVEVISSISGCCGQMDVQCCDDGFMLAENTSFKVGRYDREGNPVANFGSGDRSSVQGFGSCCNPMNVYPMSENQVLTAESSVGHIKRFDAEGNFVSYVGRAKIGGGCKHCSLGYDPDSDQYYMMHEDANSICVLENSDNLPDMTEEEKVLAQLRETYLDQLLGTWEVAYPLQTTGTGTDSERTLPVTSPHMIFKTMTFGADGSLATKGGTYANLTADWTWSITGQTDQGNLQIGLAMNQIENFTLEVDFDEPNQARVRFQNNYGSAVVPWFESTRTADCDGKPCADQECEDETAPANTSK